MRGRYFKSGQVTGLQRVITGLIGLVILWILMYAFQLILGIVTTYVNSNGTFGQSVTLLNSLPQIIGVIAGIFLVVYVVQGFRQMRVG